MSITKVLFGAALVALAAGNTLADRGDQLPTTNAKSLGEVRFRFDSSVLPDNVSTLLAATVAYADAHPGTRIVLDAHCDPIGTSPYNTGLAIRRAESVRTELRALGVPDEQLVLAIYGKEGAHRATYPEDRRVTVWSTTAPVATVIDRTFAGQGIAVRWERPLTVAEIQAPPELVARR